MHLINKNNKITFGFNDMVVAHANIIYTVIILNVCDKIRIKYKNILWDIWQILKYIGYTGHFGSCLQSHR